MCTYPTVLPLSVIGFCSFSSSINCFYGNTDSFTTMFVSANCTAGEYLDETSNKCIKCKQNYYQPEKWKTVCLKCPSDKITDGDGHANESDCVSEYVFVIMQVS